MHCLSNFFFVFKVVENVLKVNPILGPQMFQPLLPSVFRGIIDGEVRVALFNFSSLFLLNREVPSFVQSSFPVIRFLFFSCLSPSDWFFKVRHSWQLFLKFVHSKVAVEKSKKSTHRLFCDSSEASVYLSKMPQLLFCFSS